MFEMSQETFYRLYEKSELKSTLVADVKVGDIIIGHDQFVEVAFVDTTSEPSFIKILDKLRNGTIYPADAEHYVAVVTNWSDIY